MLYSFSSLKPELGVLNKIYNYEYEEITYLNSDNTIQNYESINPFEINDITDNYYFKFKDVEILNLQNNQLVKIGSCRFNDKNHWKKYGRGLCLKSKFNNFQLNTYILNFIKSNNYNFKIRFINSYKGFNYNHYIDKYDSEKIILTKDLDVLRNLKNNHRCSIVTSSRPMWISNITFNKINTRVENLVLFKCN